MVDEEKIDDATRTVSKVRFGQIKGSKKSEGVVYYNHFRSDWSE